jgi:hypothetical protein
MLLCSASFDWLFFRKSFLTLFEEPILARFLAKIYAWDKTSIWVWG